MKQIIIKPKVIEKESSSSKQITPIEIIEKFKLDTNISRDGIRSYTSTFRRLQRYGNEKNVIVYLSDIFGAVFIMKGDRKYFGFSVMNRILGRPYDYSVVERNLMDIIKFLDNNPHTQILNEPEYNKLKKILLVEGIKNEKR